MAAGNGIANPDDITCLLATCDFAPGSPPAHTRPVTFPHPSRVVSSSLSLRLHARVSARPRVSSSTPHSLYLLTLSHLFTSSRYVLRAPFFVSHVTHPSLLSSISSPPRSLSPFFFSNYFLCYFKFLCIFLIFALFTTPAFLTLYIFLAFSVLFIAIFLSHFALLLFAPRNWTTSHLLPLFSHRSMFAFALLHERRAEDSN